MIRAPTTSERIKITLGQPVCPKLYQFLPALFASNHFPIQIKQALQNPQGCFHCLELSWAGFQVEAVSGWIPKTQYHIKLMFLGFFSPLGQGEVFSCTCGSGFHLSWEAVPRMSSKCEHCSSQRFVLKFSAKQIATQQEESSAGDLQGDLCSLGSAGGRRDGLTQSGVGEGGRHLWFLFCV